METDSTPDSSSPWYRRWRTDSKLYITGAALMFIGFFGPMMQWGKWGEWGQVVVFAGVVFMGAGVLVRLVPAFRRAWKSVVVRRLVFLAHIGVLVLAAMYARNLMTSATGLPGQDFTLGTSALSLLLYPFAWLGVFVAVAGVGVMIWEVVVFARMILHSVLKVVPSAIVRRWAQHAAKGMHRNFAHLLGGFGILLGLALLHDHLRVYQSAVEGLARWAAFYGDYQAVTRYPGIAPGTRVLLHANGVYSTATVQPDRSIRIDVGMWKAPLAVRAE
ncbi:hypothetical protein ABE473_16765 [Stenotrophomonas sp. TWI700]|uniref:hypothetical protein n=1 Tax=Stenotrophomonas sp. TWI700 TaxID=3136792 RepID=UPI00320A79BA